MLFEHKTTFKETTPLELAFIGDAVFELMVREVVLYRYNLPIGDLNKIKADKVCCRSQSAMAKKVQEYLTEQEIKIYKSGRNAHVSHIPKNSKRTDYQRATGLETLFGYLYLNGKIERLKEIFFKII